MDTLQLKNLYQCERDSLNLLCEKWQRVMEYSDKRPSNEETKGAILSVLGQSRLLLNKKMKQFEQLLVDFGREEGGNPPITLQDLQGFWELIMIQVNELQTKFANLEKKSSSESVQRPLRPSGSGSQQKAKTFANYRRQ